MRYFPFAVIMAVSTPVAAQSIDRTQVARVVDEGTNHSEVMVTAEHLSDVIGPRLTNSPGMRKAEAWTQEQFRRWRLSNVHTEGFAFGRGWWIERSSVRMVSPRPVPLPSPGRRWSWWQSS